MVGWHGDCMWAIRVGYDGGVAAWERRAMDGGRIRLDGAVRSLGARHRRAGGKAAGRAGNGLWTIVGTCPPSTPHLPPIYSPSKQPNPTTRFWVQTGQTAI